MNAFKVDKTSLSYRWNKRLWWAFADLDREYLLPKDFCTYWRHTLIYSPLVILMAAIVMGYLTFVIGMILYGAITATGAFFIIVGAIVAMIAVISAYFAWVHNAAYKYLYAPLGRTIWKYGLGQIFRAIGAIISFIFVKVVDSVLFVWNSVKPAPIEISAEEAYADIDVEPKQPNFLMQKYYALKEAYCPMVEYTK